MDFQSQHLDNESHVTSKGGDRIKDHHGKTKIETEKGQNDRLKTRGTEQDNVLLNRPCFRTSPWTSQRRGPGGRSEGGPRLRYFHLTSGASLMLG